MSHPTIQTKPQTIPIHAYLDAQFHQNGIHCTYEDPFTNQIRHRFIRISTIIPIQKLEFTTIQRQGQIEDIQRQFQYRNNRIRGGSRLREDVFTELMNVYRQGVVVMNNLTSVKEFQQQREQFHKVYLTRKYIKMFNNLQNAGIELIFRPTKKGTILIALVDYGPEFPDSTDHSVILNRLSPLDLYPNLTHMDRLITLISPNRVTLHRIKPIHPQAIELDKHILEKLIIKSTVNPKFKPLPKNQSLFSQSQTRYIFTETKQMPFLPNFGDLRSKLSLNPGNILMVNLEDHEFQYFLMNFAYLHNLSQLTNPENYPKIPNLNLLYFGINRPMGFRTQRLETLGLDTMNLETVEAYKSFRNLVTPIDVIFGDEFDSEIAAIDQLLSDLIEYDPNLVASVKSIQDFLEILERQLTNRSYLGDLTRIKQIYLLFERFKLRNVLNKGETTVEQLHPFTHFETEKNHVLNVMAVMFLLNMKLGSIHNSLENYVLIIDDQRIIRRLGDERMSMLVSKLRNQHPKLSILIHADANWFGWLDSIPRIEKVTDNDSENKLKTYQINFGRGVKSQIDLYRMTSYELETIKAYDKFIQEESHA